MEPKRHNTRHAAARAAAAQDTGFSSPSPSPPGHRGSPQDTPKSDMYEAFQAWALKTYGDSAKTKTVTRRKYNRILKILKGEEQTSAENSKFRFWVKAKGFRIGPPHGHGVSNGEQILYIPCSKVPFNQLDNSTNGREATSNDSEVMCEETQASESVLDKTRLEVEGRSSNVSSNLSGGERGESMVYKKVAVVENFYDIIYGVHVEMDGRGGKHAGQKRTYKAIAEMYSFLPREAVTHFLMSCTDCQKRMHLGAEQRAASSSCHDNEPEESLSSLDTAPGDDSMHIDYSLPITTTYLKHMRSLGYSEEDALNPDREDSEDVESEVSEEANTPINPSTSAQIYEAAVKEEASIDSPTSAGPSRRRIRRAKHSDRSMAWSQESVSEEPINMIKGSFSNNHHDHSYERTVSPCNGCTKREASSTPDNLSAGTKDEDDEDDDDDTDKIDMNKYDPERLKAFNMFVRLFVDENLDRMVPISRQPKDKIQAIIDSCSRQFPEFGERARKRIRTYLKSCRRNKRTRETSSWELGRNTQPHLTSALAEQILASACENESQNAKRMRLGLKPIPADVDRGRSETRSPQQEAQQRHGKTSSPSLVNGTQGSSYSSSTYRLVPNSTSNGHSSSHGNTSNGPTDLSMKKGLCNQSNTVKHSLNPSEVVAVKQLIAGYRESAAFLLRSADELEQLLLQQN